MAAQRRSAAAAVRPPPASFAANPKAPPPTRRYTCINEGTDVVTKHTFHNARYLLLMSGLIVLVVVSRIEYGIVSLQALSKAPARCLATQAAPQQNHAGRSRSPSLRGGSLSEACPIPSPVLHPLWLQRRPNVLRCNHYLHALQYDCQICRMEFMEAEMNLMVTRPEGAPALNSSESRPSEGGVAHWDALSRYVHAHEGSMPFGMQGTGLSDGTGGSSASSSRVPCNPPPLVPEAGYRFRDLGKHPRWEEQGASRSGAPSPRKRQGTELSSLADAVEERPRRHGAEVPEHEARQPASPCTPAPWEKDGLDADAMSDLSEFGDGDEGQTDQFNWNFPELREEILKKKVLRKLFRRQRKKDEAIAVDQTSLAQDAEDMSAYWCKAFCPGGRPCDHHRMWFQAALEGSGRPESAAQRADKQPEPEPPFTIPDDSDDDEALLAACRAVERSILLANKVPPQQGAESSTGPGGSSASASSGWVPGFPPPLSWREQSVPPLGSC